MSSVQVVKAYRWRKPDIRGRPLFDAVIADGDRWMLLVGAPALDAGCQSFGPFFSEADAVRALTNRWPEGPFYDTQRADPSEVPETEL